LDFISEDECLCDLGWTGTWCDTPAELCTIGEDSCGAGECGPNQICDCPQGYFGQRCELSICDDACENDGECSIVNNENGPATYKCTCPDYATGTNCEQTPCDEYDVCQNGGLCELDEVGRPYCDCPDLWVGEFCEKDTAQNQCREEALAGIMEPGDCNYQPICSDERRMLDYITIKPVNNGFR